MAVLQMEPMSDEWFQQLSALIDAHQAVTLTTAPSFAAGNRLNFLCFRLLHSVFTSPLLMSGAGCFYISYCVCLAPPRTSTPPPTQAASKTTSCAQPTQKRAQPQPLPFCASTSSTLTSQPAPKRSHDRRRDASPKPTCSTRAKKEKTLAKYAKKACQNRSKLETVWSSARSQASTPNTASLMMPLANACSSATSLNAITTTSRRC